MAIPFDQYLRGLTTEEVEQSAYNLLGAIGIPATSWAQGGVARGIIRVVSRLFSGVTGVVSVVTRGTLLDYAEGIYLTALAYYQYHVQRQEAVFATGVVTVSNSSGNSYSFAEGELRLTNTLTNAEFQNTSVVNISPMQVGVLVDVIALVAGSDSTSTPGSITSFVTPKVGLSCTNANAIVGLDEETDAALRIRCHDALGALSPNGPKEAYAYIAKTATRLDGSPIGVNRVSTSVDSGTGVVLVYVADPDGPIDPLDLAIIDNEIQTKVVPLGITAIVANATPINVPITATVWVRVRSNVTQLKVITDISNALVQYFILTPIGGEPLVDGGPGFLMFSDLLSVIDNSNSAIYKVLLSSPTADLPLDPNEVPLLGTVNLTVNLV